MIDVAVVYGLEFEDEDPRKGWISGAVRWQPDDKMPNNREVTLDFYRERTAQTIKHPDHRPGLSPVLLDSTLQTQESRGKPSGTYEPCTPPAAFLPTHARTGPCSRPSLAAALAFPRTLSRRSWTSGPTSDGTSTASPGRGPASWRRAGRSRRLPSFGSVAKKTSLTPQ